MIYFIGLDDTDNKDSRGTGFKSRELGRLIVENKLGDVDSITRHQLYVHEKIAYTSHNSSASLVVKTNNQNLLKEFCIDYLIQAAEPGSDAGLCIAHTDSIDSKIIDWGNRAKKEILTKEDAYKLAIESNIFLEGYTGSKIGVIGSLAAVGLRRGGNDGRNIWLKGKELRDLHGVYKISELKKIVNIQVVQTIDNIEVSDSDFIDLGDWIRPVVMKNKITVIVEQNKQSNYGWKIVSKDIIKSLSD